MMPGVHPLLRKAEMEALQSQLETLRGEIAAYYEELRSGREQVFISHSLDRPLEALIKARIAVD